MTYADPAVGREADRERFHRRTAERRAAGLCPRCGHRSARARPEPVRRLRRETQPGEPRPRRQAAGGGTAASGPGQGSIL